MDVLWPDLTPKAAANDLRYALHKARRILGHTSSTASWCLPLRNGLITLCPSGELWVDVEGFDEAAETARYVRNLPAYQAAVELYGGDLLPEDRYEAWAKSCGRLCAGRTLRCCSKWPGFTRSMETSGRALRRCGRRCQASPRTKVRPRSLCVCTRCADLGAKPCGNTSSSGRLSCESTLRAFSGGSMAEGSTLVLPLQPVAVSLM